MHPLPGAPRTRSIYISKINRDHTSPGRTQPVKSLRISNSVPSIFPKHVLKVPHTLKKLTNASGKVLIKHLAPPNPRTVKSSKITPQVNIANYREIPKCFGLISFSTSFRCRSRKTSSKSNSLSSISSAVPAFSFSLSAVTGPLPLDCREAALSTRERFEYRLFKSANCRSAYWIST